MWTSSAPIIAISSRASAAKTASGSSAVSASRVKPPHPREHGGQVERLLAAVGGCDTHTSNLASRRDDL